MSRRCRSTWIGLPAGSGSPSKRRGRAPRRGGFTLLEVLVAFTILAVALVALVRAFAGGLQGLEAAGAGLDALHEARSLLAEVGGPIPLEPGTHRGALAGGGGWTVTIESHDLGDAAAAGLLPLVPYDVVVRVEGAGRVRLQTLRLGPRP